MSITTLEAAIARLEELKAGAAALPWQWDEKFTKGSDYDSGGGLALTNDDGAEVVGAYNFHCCEFRDDVRAEPGDQELIAALSHTVDPMLDILRFARGMAGAQVKGEQAAATVDLALYLARAILGEVKHD